MMVEVLAVGTELLLGQIVNSNAAEIGSRLAAAGLDHYRQAVVGDNLERVSEAIVSAASRSDAVVITGGIGPTPDDLTREALGAAAGVGMVFDEEYAGHLARWWERRGRAMPASNLRQAEHPEGAVLLENRKGTAPGLRMRVGDAWVFALPGVPQEMIPMLETHVIPFLLRESGSGEAVLVSRVIRTWGESESRVAELLDDLYRAAENPTMAFLASSGEIKIRLTARAADEQAAAVLLDPIQAEVERRLGSKVFAVDGDSIEGIVLRLAAERGWTVGTAESATGGMVAARFTSVPGSSAVFAGSVVAYTAELKAALLGVPGSTMAEHGVVSPETASAMAEGLAERLGVDVAIAVTGAAGPEPHERPPGTIVLAVRTPEDVGTIELRMPGDRERVRTFATTAALQLARLAITGEWWRRR